MTNQNIVDYVKRRDDYIEEEVNVYQIGDRLNNILKVDKSIFRNLTISGSRGIVVLGSKLKFNNSTISFSVDSFGCSVVILNSPYSQKLNIAVNKIQSSVFIDENFSSNGISISVFDGKGVFIGKDNMWAAQVDCKNTDAHTILDLSGNVINPSEDIFIMDHVWIAHGVRILKGVILGANTVVGTGAIVTKKFINPNQILAGIPAKVVKKGINWDRRSVPLYMKCHESNKK